MRRHIQKIKKHFTHHYHKAIKTKKSPEAIAMGFSVGTFIAIFPTFGLGLLVVLAIMFFYKKMSRIAAIAGLAFWGIFMMAPIFYLSPRIGRLFFNFKDNAVNQSAYKITEIFSITPFTFHNFFNFMKVYARDYLIGNTILAIIISFISYFIVKQAVINYRKQKEERLKNKNKKSSGILQKLTKIIKK